MCRQALMSLACLACLTGCASGPDGAGPASPAVDGAQPATAQSVSGPLPASRATAFTPERQYRIGPLDKLDIQVFQVPEVSRSVQVASNGEINLPLIGSVKVAGKTVGEVAALLSAKLRQYIQAPEVTVQVSGYNSQRVTVDGAVGSPGVFPVTPDATLLRVVVLAGGLQRTASSNDVLIFRTVEGKRMVAKFNVEDIRAGRLSDPQIYGGDMVMVPQSAVKSAYTDLLGLLPMASFVMGVF